MRRAVQVLLAVAVVAIVVVGLKQASGPSKPEAAAKPFVLSDALKQLDGAPPALASLHTQHSALLGGGVQAFRERVRALRGHPVVINKWAHWCGPCKAEFPFFQRVSTDYGRRVAFLGIDGSDNATDARAFLRKLPLPFPSYSDKREAIARAYDAPATYPITVFLDAHGKQVYIHNGQYRRAADLRTDIKRYLQ